MWKCRKWSHYCCHHTWGSARHSTQTGSCWTPRSAWSWPSNKNLGSSLAMRPGHNGHNLSSWSSNSLANSPITEENKKLMAVSRPYIYIVAFPCIQVGSSGLVGYVCAEFQWANMWSRWSLCDIELQILFLFFLFLIKSTNKMIFFPRHILLIEAQYRVKKFIFYSSLTLSLSKKYFKYFKIY